LRRGLCRVSIAEAARTLKQRLKALDTWRKKVKAAENSPLKAPFSAAFSQVRLLLELLTKLCVLEIPNMGSIGLRSS